MSLEIKAPSPGESIRELIIANWYKKDGDFVKKDEIIAEMESEKANLEIIAEVAGILEIKAKEGQTVAVDSVIAVIKPQLPNNNHKTQENLNPNTNQPATSEDATSLDKLQAKDPSNKQNPHDKQNTGDKQNPHDKQNTHDKQSLHDKQNNDKYFSDITTGQTATSEDAASLGQTPPTIEDATSLDKSQAKDPRNKHNLHDKQNTGDKQKNDKYFANTTTGQTATSEDAASLGQTPPTIEDATSLDKLQDKGPHDKQNTGDKQNQHDKQNTGDKQNNDKYFDLIVPSPGESILEVELVQWFKKDGDFVLEGEDIYEIESEKANLSITAEISGILSLKAKQGSKVNVGDIVAVIKEQAPTTQASQKNTKPLEKPESLPFLETAKIKETNVQSAVKPTIDTNKDSQIANKDTIVFGMQNLETAKAPSVEKISTSQKIDKPTEIKAVEESLISLKLDPSLAETKTQERKIEIKKISHMRQKIAEKLHYATQSTAMLTTFNEVTMDAILGVRKEYKDLFYKAYGIKLGFLSFFVKASCLALKEFPNVNSQINMETSEHSFFNYVDMGIAVSAPRGLMVPVLRDAHRLSIAQIEQKILALAKKARDGRIQVDEMIGGTFTITNGGIFGSMLSTPILNSPQSAILAMHNITPRAVVVDGEIKVASVMYLALTYDHRVIDGKDAVSFLVRVKNYLENPVRMLLGI